MTRPEPLLHIKSTQTLDAMLHQVLNQALVMIGARAGSLMLVDNKQGILQIKARLGEPRPGRRDERVFRIEDRSIASTVVRERQSHICDHIDQDPLFLSSRTARNFLSLLSVPIVHNNQVLAVINADSPQPGFFDVHKQRLLEEVACEAAGPIAERISVLSALAEVGFQLTLLPRRGGIDSVLEKIAELAVRSLGADVVTVYQYDQAADEFLVEGTGPTIGGDVWDPRPMQRKVYPRDVPWTVVKERKPGFYVDVPEQEFLTSQVSRPDQEPRPRFVAREGIKSMAALLLPFRAAEIPNEEVVGVMFANYRTPHTFNIDETAALATFADYAAVAVLNARREEQRRTEQMRLVQSISASFAHAMTNLAGPGRVAVQLLQERIDPNEERVQRHLGIIAREADRLMGLAGRLRGRLPDENDLTALSEVDLGCLLSEELQTLLEGSGIELTTRIDPDLPRVQSVEFQLRQVLHDVLGNAVEAVAHKPIRRIEVRVRAGSDLGHVELEISDNGDGISEDVAGRLFLCGVTDKKDGLGVGLWYSRTFLQALGGDIRLKESVKGRGCTFLIEIPVNQTAVDGDPPARPGAAREGLAGGQERSEGRD